MFRSLDEHLARRLAWQPLARSCAPSHPLIVAAILGEGGRRGLARAVLDFQTIGAPPQVSERGLNPALM